MSCQHADRPRPNAHVGDAGPQARGTGGKPGTFGTKRLQRALGRLRMVANPLLRSGGRDDPEPHQWPLAHKLEAAATTIGTDNPLVLHGVDAGDNSGSWGQGTSGGGPAGAISASGRLELPGCCSPISTSPARPQRLEYDVTAFGHQP